ncbi:MAG TPA: acetoin utilization protein AcuC [Alphaproteobacteria bacterium]|nr:acetoin utilization protein AcuC [Alphaproteobacteria bacterium]
MPAALLYTEQWAQYTYGAHHPLKPIRLQLTYDLMHAYGLLDGHAQTIPVIEATIDDLLGFHSVEYLNVLQTASQGEQVPTLARYGLGPGDNPVFPGLFHFSSLVVGASLQAAQLVEAGAASVAFNIAGGLHHGRPSQASGFCYLNDVVVAIDYLVSRGHRVAYVDIDTHHGDGVQAAYYHTDKVLTISLHESGRYLFPGTGFEHEIGEGQGLGYAVNVPLHPYTDDEVFTWAFQQVVPPLISRFRPDILVTQLGVDTFRSDPLSDLELTTEGFCTMVKALQDLNLPWVALGGGCYDVPNVPRAWTLAWAIMNERPLPNDLPDVYLETAARAGFPNNTGRSLHDAPYRSDSQRREAAWRTAERAVRFLQEQALPLVGKTYPHA